MKPTDFSVHVTSFLTHYLAAQRNVSPNTIKAYRDVFTLLLRFCRDVQGIALEKLRLGSACSGVGRSLRRRRAFGSTRADSPSGKGAQNARCAFDGKHSSASTESHAGKPPRSSRTVRQASFPQRAPRATDPFRSSLHPSQIRRSFTKQVSEFKPNRKPPHAETYKGYGPVAERSLSRHDPRLPRPRGC